MKAAEMFKPEITSSLLHRQTTGTNKLLSDVLKKPKIKNICNLLKSSNELRRLYESQEGRSAEQLLESEKNGNEIREHFIENISMFSVEDVHFLSELASLIPLKNGCLEECFEHTKLLKAASSLDDNERTGLLNYFENNADEDYRIDILLEDILYNHALVCDSHTFFPSSSSLNNDSKGTSLPSENPQIPASPHTQMEAEPPNDPCIPKEMDLLKDRIIKDRLQFYAKLPASAYVDFSKAAKEYQNTYLLSGKIPLEVLAERESLIASSLRSVSINSEITQFLNPSHVPSQEHSTYSDPFERKRSAGSLQDTDDPETLPLERGASKVPRHFAGR